MSGQWEVVGKSKKKQNGLKGKALSKAEQKKMIENGPKVEEMLPLSQVQTLYDALSNDVKENKKPGKENNGNEKSRIKKPHKVTQTKKKDTTKDKPIHPKSLETAVKLINKKELYSELEVGKISFPDAPLIWMKGLVGYLNSRLTVENIHPAFEDKSFDYPLSLLPAELKEVLKKSLMDVNPAHTQTLFEWCLTALANDMSRGDKACGAVLGYKMILQLLAFHNPSLAVSSIAKVKALLMSYHNRQSIGLSILWSIGQGGYQDFGIGLHVWHEVIFPMVDLRLYSAYVIVYLQRLLTKHPGKQQLNSEYFLPVLKLLSSPPVSVPTNRRKDFQDLAPLLLARVLEIPFEKAFLPLFPVLLQLLEETAPNRLLRELETMLLTGLLTDSRVGSKWVNVYPQMRPQSRHLLLHLSKIWNKVHKSKHKELKTLFKGLHCANLLLEKQGINDSNMQACERLSLELQRRMATARATSGFPWMRANFLMLAAIAALLIYDVRRHGSLRASSTGHFLHDIGALPYIRQGWKSTQTYTHQSYRWFLKHGPDYYHHVCDASRPYLLQVQELLIAGGTHIAAGCQTVYAYTQEKAPLISEWVDERVPGLRERSIELGLQIWEQCKEFTVTGGQALWEFGQDTVSWARTNVFIGSWSPDNLQQYSFAVLNVTQHYALGTYDWLYEKVQTFSKVE